MIRNRGLGINSTCVCRRSVRNIVGLTQEQGSIRLLCSQRCLLILSRLSTPHALAKQAPMKAFSGEGSQRFPPTPFLEATAVELSVLWRQSGHHTAVSRAFRRSSCGQDMSAGLLRLKACCCCCERERESLHDNLKEEPKSTLTRARNTAGRAPPGCPGSTCSHCPS